MFSTMAGGDTVFLHYPRRTEMTKITAFDEGL